MRYKPPPELVYQVLSRLTGSWTYHSFGHEHIRAALRQSPTGAVVFAFWHQSILGVLGRHKDQNVAALASMSADGEIMSSYLQRIGMASVRGSSSRGGLAAARRMVKNLKRGTHVALAVDGPRGPMKEVKEGVVFIARLAGCPIVPMAVRARSEYSFKRSWDSFRLPLPGTTVAMCYGPPQMIPREHPGEAGLLDQRRRLAIALHELEATASRLVGKGDVHPRAACCKWLHHG